MSKNIPLYDSKCKELAEHFFGDYDETILSAARKADLVERLSQHVQDAVESFFIQENLHG